MSDPITDALRLGKAMEREAIVAWLRSIDTVANHQGVHAHWFADDIESGNHLRVEDG